MDTRHLIAYCLIALWIAVIAVGMVIYKRRQREERRLRQGIHRN